MNRLLTHIEQLLGKPGAAAALAEETNPVTMAYLGDCVYELYVRSRICACADAHINQLHRQATRYVSAVGQSHALGCIEGKLTDREASIVRRGRNAKCGSPAKNASLTDYRRATAFEALLGYLYLKGETERLEQLMDLAFDGTTDKENEK